MQTEFFDRMGECYGRISEVADREVHVSLFPYKHRHSEFVASMRTNHFEGTGVVLAKNSDFRVYLEKSDDGKRIVVCALEKKAN